MKKFLPLFIAAFVIVTIPAIASGITNLWTTQNGGINFPITPTSIDSMVIGGTTPAAGNFTTLTSTSPPSGAGFTALFASPPPIGATAPGSGKFTTIDASGQITSSTGLPTITSGDCGTTTNGVVVAGSTNQSGSITIGAAATTTCKITWSATLTAAPKACSITPMNAAAAAQGTTVMRVGAPTTADVTITGTALANANYNFICL